MTKKLSDYLSADTPRTMATVIVGSRFFCGTLLERDGDEATVIVDTPQGGACVLTGKEIR
jgi:uncharacterized membrane protein YgdD (TMEM256/DUF423 family)